MQPTAQAVGDRSNHQQPRRGERKPTATPAPAVTYGPKMLHSTNNDRPLFSTMWKTRPEPRTKPVIARDTTCSVSLLTGTICGSNFAIPSTKIPAHGNGTEFPKWYRQIRMRSGAQPEVTRHPPQ